MQQENTRGRFADTVQMSLRRAPCFPGDQQALGGRLVGYPLHRWSVALAPFMVPPTTARVATMMIEHHIMSHAIKIRHGVIEWARRGTANPYPHLLQQIICMATRSIFLKKSGEFFSVL